MEKESFEFRLAQDFVAISSVVSKLKTEYATKRIKNVLEEINSKIDEKLNY